MESNTKISGKRMRCNDSGRGYTITIMGYDCPDRIYIKHMGKRRFGLRENSSDERMFVIDSYHLNYVIDGEGTFDGKPICKGKGFLVCPGKMHSFYSNHANPITHFWIALAGNDDGKLLKDAGIPLKNHVFDCPWIDEASLLLESSMECDLGNKDVPSYMRALLDYLLSFHKVSFVPEKLPDKKEMYVNSAKAFMDTHYNENITVEDVANYVNLSSKYLCAIFNETEKISTQQYLIALRLDAAAKLLAQTELSVGETAKNCGYSDVYVFSKTFSKKYGMSPSAYRKSFLR